MKKRQYCLTSKELAYLLLISTAVGCSQNSPDYKTVYNECVNNKDYCTEKEKLDQLVQTSPNSQSGGWNQNVNNGSSSGMWNYLLMYHIFFNRSSNVNPGLYANRFSNYNASKTEEDRQRYRGFGVYNRAYVSRMRSSIESGKTSFSTKSGMVMKSAQFANSTRSSITGRSITRGSAGSTGRSMGISS